MLELLFELLVLLVFVQYLYKDYQKAKLEGKSIEDYFRSWVKGFVLLAVILMLLHVFLEAT